MGDREEICDPSWAVRDQNTVTFIVGGTVIHNISSQHASKWEFIDFCSVNSGKYETFAIKLNFPINL